jgi:hypothetical protein
MSTHNPYQSPQSRVAATDIHIEDIAAGQKLVIYAILTYFVAAAARVAVGPFAIVVFLAAVGLAIAGILKLGTGLGFSTLVKVLCVGVMFIPLIGLIMLVVVNSKATGRLRAAGYSVGLLGARP